MILRVIPGRHNKDEVLKPSPADKIIVMYLTKATTNLNVAMKCVFCFHYRNINEKLLIFLLLLHVFHNLHAVCSFHNFVSLICFVNDYVC